VLTAQEEGWPLDQIPQDEAMDAIVNATYDARSYSLGAWE